MRLFARNIRLGFQLFLLSTLVAFFCPLMPTNEAQAQEEAKINSASDEVTETNYNGSPLSAESGTSIVNWTISGSCEWMIDTEGCLIIRPQSGKSEGSLAYWGDSAHGYDPPWEDSKSSIRSVRIEKGVIAYTCLKMFQECPNLTTAELGGLDTSHASRMDYMFKDCPLLMSLDLTSFNTPKATDMDDMFYGCSSLKSIDLASFDTSKVGNMEDMFCGCSSLTSLDLTSFNTSKVWNMSGMFYGCSSLTSLDLTSFNTSNVTTMSSMFEKCASLASLDMSSFDMSSSPYMYATFWGCNKLHSVKLGSKFVFDTHKAHANSQLPTPSGAGLTGYWIKEGDEAGKTYTSSDIYWLARGYDDPSGRYYAQGTLESAELSVDTEPEIYTGSPIIKTISSPGLVEGVDYAVEYSSNVDVGEAHLVIKGIGGCTGRQEHSFRILQADPAFEVPEGLAAAYGQTLADVALPEGFSWQEDASTPVGAVGENAFHAVYTPADERNYKTVRDIEVAVRVSPASIAALDFGVDEGDAVYTGEPRTKAVSCEGLAEGADYKVTYSDNVEAGTAKLVIEGVGNYSGRQEHSFRILQADPAFEVPEGLAAAYGQTLADVALPEGFSWQEDASTPVGAVGENAFHAVYTPADERNYKTVRDIEVAVRVSPAKVEAPVLENMTFNGAEQIVGVPSSNLFTAIENSPERNAGRYEVIFRLNDKASYVWSSTESSEDLAVFYDIAPAKSTDISIEPIPQQQWTGLEITPTTTLKIGENTLQEGIDYVFDYKDNIDEGTGIAIARSKGNISDDIEIPFTIARSEEPSPAPNPAPQPQPQQYDIVYHLDGGVNATDNPATYTTGISVTLADPTKKGFEFQGWYTDKEFKNQVTEISAKSTGSINLWAKWSKLAMRPFPDVDYSSWYAPGVEFVQEKGLMTGYDNAGLFGIGKTLTRGEFATILWRHACPEEAAVYDPSTAEDKTGMAGSADGMFYTAAANWAVENGIITGYIHEDGTHDFAANDPVTFEQLITILARYSANGTGANLTNVDLSAFLDGEKASDWAAPSLTWAAEKGLVQGYDTASGKMLSPGEDVARERVAVVLMRAFELGLLK